jgi:hypothetical protein
MGAWSAEPFGNDTAADFAWELEESRDWARVEGALAEALVDEQLDADTASVAIAAAEIVAHGLGSPTQSDSYTQSVEAFISRVGAPPADLVGKAKQALTAAESPDGELSQLWEESGIGDWAAENARLMAALGG